MVSCALVEALNTGLAAPTHAQLFDVLKTLREGLAASIASISLKGGHKPLYLGLMLGKPHADAS